MKKIILISVIILVLGSSLNTFADNGIKVFINGEIVEFDTEPAIISGRTLVPIRPVCEKLGADVYWWGEEKAVFIVKNNIKILLVLDCAGMKVFECDDFEQYYELHKNDEMVKYVREIETDIAPVIINGRTLMPIRYVCEALGADVEWSASDSAVHIKCSDDILKTKNTDKSFFDKLYFCSKWPVHEILATAKTNDERVEKAIYFLELYFKTNALMHEEVSPIENFYFDIKNTAIYKLKSEYHKYHIDEEYIILNGDNIDYIVEMEGVTNQYSYMKGYDFTYAVTFYKDGSCGLGVEFKYVDNELEHEYQFYGTCPSEMKSLVRDYDIQYNKLITYPSSDGTVIGCGI